MRSWTPLEQGPSIHGSSLSCSVGQSCLTLCDPMDCSLQGSSVHGILQAGTLEWVSISFSRDLPNPGIEPRSPVSSELQVNSPPTETSKKHRAHGRHLVSLYLVIKGVGHGQSLNCFLLDPLYIKTWHTAHEKICSNLICQQQLPQRGWPMAALGEGSWPGPHILALPSLLFSVLCSLPCWLGLELDSLVSGTRKPCPGVFYLGFYKDEGSSQLWWITKQAIYCLHLGRSGT